MNVLIRPESDDNQELMAMLKRASSNMILRLKNHNIILADNSVKIWIKRFSENRLYPKIEFDVGNQELQYDMTADGFIREAHFKSFIRTASGTKRHDLDKMSADPLLITIDNILRF
ncbi:hypothetical protein J6A31_04605 [bacterium]|nr:hypothetical protein [bacterium]